MSKENTRERKLQYIFAQHPNDKELHVTSDDQAFRNKSDAINHGKTLSDKEVKLEKREDYAKPSPVKDEKAKAPADDAKTEAKKEREALFARHEELFGQKPASTAPTAKVKAKIEAEEARLAEVAAKDAESGDDDTNGEGDSSGEEE